MKNQVLAFDIGGTHIRAAVIRKNKILNYIQVSTSKNKNKFLKQIEQLIEQLNSKSISGIGIGIASPIKDGKIKNAPNIPLKNFDLKKYLETKYKKKVEIKNDAGCFALAEAKLGIKKKNFILITLGTGIGGAIVINGEVHRGAEYGTELGHMYIQNQQWETSWKQTKNQIKKEFKEQKLIKDLIKINNKKSNKILNQAADNLGQGIASLISALDPEAIVIGGGVRDSGPQFIKLIKQKTKKYSFLPKETPIVWTKLEHPGIIGASLLI